MCCFRVLMILGFLWLLRGFRSFRALGLFEGFRGLGGFRVSRFCVFRVLGVERF